jgi:hypothetical protein
MIGARRSRDSRETSGFILNLRRLADGIGPAAHCAVIPPGTTRMHDGIMLSLQQQNSYVEPETKKSEVRPTPKTHDQIPSIICGE